MVAHTTEEQQDQVALAGVVMVVLVVLQIAVLLVRLILALVAVVVHIKVPRGVLAVQVAQA